MKKFSFVFGVIAIATASLQNIQASDDIKNNFQAHLNQKAIDALTQDLGALIAGGSFHTGKALDFPIGFDIGVHVPIVTFQDENKILKDDESTWAATIAQVEVGLPGKINVIGRYGTLGEGDVVGGGLRYGILKPSVPGIPSLSLSVLYDRFNHDYVELDTYSSNLALSFDLPVIRPYIGVGYDWNNLDVTDEAYVGAPSGTPSNLESDETGYRAEVGVNLSMIPFTYITLGVGLANGGEMYHAGLGVTF